MPIYSENTRVLWCKNGLGIELPISCLGDDSRPPPTTRPIPGRNFCSSFSVASGFLAASLTSFLLVILSIMLGHVVLDNVTVEPCFLHLIITYLICLCSNFTSQTPGFFTGVFWLSLLHNSDSLGCFNSVSLSFFIYLMSAFTAEGFMKH